MHQVNIPETKLASKAETKLHRIKERTRLFVFGPRSLPASFPIPLLNAYPWAAAAHWHDNYARSRAWLFHNATIFLLIARWKARLSMLGLTATSATSAKETKLANKAEGKLHKIKEPPPPTTHTHARAHSNTHPKQQQQQHTRARAHTHAHTHTRTHTHTHTTTPRQSLAICCALCPDALECYTLR